MKLFLLDHIKEYNVWPWFELQVYPKNIFTFKIWIIHQNVATLIYTLSTWWDFIIVNNLPHNYRVWHRYKFYQAKLQPRNNKIWAYCSVKYAFLNVTRSKTNRQYIFHVAILWKTMLIRISINELKNELINTRNYI